MILSVLIISIPGPIPGLLSLIIVNLGVGVATAKTSHVAAEVTLGWTDVSKRQAWVSLHN